MHYFTVFLQILVAAFVADPMVTADEGKTWCVLIVGCNYYKYTYGMEGAVYRMYDTLLNGGIPAENIIVLSPDAVAFHPNNVSPGLVSHAYANETLDNAPNYYENVIIDYVETITPQMFFDILSGNSSNPMLKEMGSGRVVKSGPKDNIFIYYNGIGYWGHIFLNNRYDLRAETLVPFLEDLKENNKFNKMLIHIESTFSGACFDDFLDTDKNILVYSLGGRYNYMSLCDFNKMVDAYTAICGGKAVHKYFDMMLPANGHKENIFDTLVNSRLLNWENDEVHNLYGTIPMGKEKISTFLGKDHKKSNTPMDLDALKKELSNQDTVSLTEAIMTDPSIVRPKERTRLNKVIENIIKKSIDGTKIEYETVLETKIPIPAIKDKNCVVEAYQTANSKCFNQRNRLLLTVEADKFANLCHLKVPKQKIIAAINHYCSKK